MNTRRILLLFFALATPVTVLLAVLLFSLFREEPVLTGVVRAADGAGPIAGATIAVGGRIATTTPDGVYTIGYERGKLALHANADGYIAVQADIDASDLLVKSLRVDLDLEPNRLTGYIVDGETIQALANAPLEIAGRRLTTDAQGAFAVRAVMQGARIAVNLPGYEPVQMKYAGEPHMNIQLTPNSVVVSVGDPSGQPIARAQIRAGSQSTVTDAGGRGVLRRVNPDTPIQVSAAGYDETSASPSGDGVRLVLRPNFLEGIVIDAVSGRPISNTLVYHGSAVLTSDARGTFRIDQFPPKTALVFKAPGHRITRMTIEAGGRREIKLQPFLVKGIHVPFGIPAQDVFAAMDLIKKTELNSIVLDVKAEKGRVGWASEVPLAKQIGAPYSAGVELKQVLERCRKDEIYCIARVPVFQDNLLATTRVDLALRYPNGRIFVESSGAAWSNAANPTVWDYNIALAQELAVMGFEEIQFDYVRFPGGEPGLYTGTLATEDGRVAAIVGFLARAQKQLRPYPVFVSADVFGLTTASNDDDYTGQRLKDLGPYLDYVSPMVYPDVWVRAGYLLSEGLRIKNCTEAVRCPYDVIYQSYKRAAEKTNTPVRLWLQAYAGRGNYGIPQYKLQKKAAEEAGSVGWMFWNGAGNYDPRMFEAKN